MSIYVTKLDIKLRARILWKQAEYILTLKYVYVLSIQQPIIISFK